MAGIGLGGGGVRRSESQITTVSVESKDDLPSFEDPVLASIGGGSELFFSPRGTVNYMKVAERTKLDSGIGQIDWTSDGDGQEGFEQLGFVGGGEQVPNITSIGLGGN